MKKEDLYRAMDGIEDTMLEEAERTPDPGIMVIIRTAAPITAIPPRILRYIAPCSTGVRSASSSIVSSIPSIAR